jgi:VanZ family protein
MSGTLEHAAAYLVLGLLTGLVLRARWRTLPVASALTAYAGLLEALQIFVPGRIAAFVDFCASTAGGLSGLALAAVVAGRMASSAERS